MGQRKFSEMPGGIIVGPFGRDVLRLNLDSLTLREAQLAMDAILPALEAAFAAKGDDDKG